MKCIKSIFQAFSLFSLLLLSSCGSDNTAGNTKSASNTLNASQCGCAASYMPVCGANNITYDNACIANCFGITQTVQGSCICSERPVCGDNNQTYSECEAQAAMRTGEIRKIIKFVDCNSASY